MIPDRLATLLADPAGVSALSPAEAASAAADLATLLAALARRAAEREPERTENGAALLTVERAAALAGVTVEQFYRRKRFRPACVRLGHRTLRVNERKLRRILGA